MKSIFLDLEFCEIKKEYEEKRTVTKNEIIQIGAVELDENNHICNRFDTFVKPQFGEISFFVTQLTHIEPKDVEEAPYFKEAIHAFERWIGDSSAKIYTWSNCDLIQIQRECQIKSYRSKKLDRLYKNWVDYQKVFGKIMGINQGIALTNAVYGAGFDMAGRPHSAIVDAENTARLYALTQNKEQFAQKKQDIYDVVCPKPALTTSIGSLFTQEMIKNLPKE